MKIAIAGLPVTQAENALPIHAKEKLTIVSTRMKNIMDDIIDGILPTHLQKLIVRMVMTTIVKTVLIVKTQTVQVKKVLTIRYAVRVTMIVLREWFV